MCHCYSLVFTVSLKQIQGSRSHFLVPCCKLSEQLKLKKSYINIFILMMFFFYISYYCFLLRILLHPLEFYNRNYRDYNTPPVCLSSVRNSWDFCNSCLYRYAANIVCFIACHPHIYMVTFEFNTDCIKFQNVYGEWILKYNAPEIVKLLQIEQDYKLFV